ncbi:LEAF RUST 10 DISEASE-RESISTANCE LOCUS RECEPTOR-LIKE PROTEIN KINASE-like 1.2 isoform X2 [Juglans regia]|uniref:non-specific serine/threonine protein kinase n=2 Tax=Juglans regia TaxID=51240 RepID=A0A6P9E3Q8_JUGRE|nr:LEAF RUST 10 DISEASE-RESISTANCE LOCUS RECEPTOR-LIKE PROTEIN KINASE-like 1.2 isoform X2 [Juglans regia]
MSQPLTIFLVFLSLFFTNSSATDPSSSPTTCRPSQSTCGNVTIRYPFWLQGNNSNTTANNSYCGYRGFGLTCSDAGDEPAVLSLPSDTYYVKDINYTAHTLTLADIDATNQLCPRARHNVTLQTLPLNFSAEYDLNLSFYFNCSKYPPFLPAIACLEHQLMRSFVFVEGTERMEGFELWSEITCEEKVVATVMRSGIEISNLTRGFGGAMNNGFVLDWGVIANCSTCERSSGYCGYNETAGELLCFCNNGSIRRGRCKDQKKDWGLKAGIGAGTAAVTVVIMCIIFCIYQQHKKKKYVPSSLRSPNASSYPSSTVDSEMVSTYFGVHLFSYTELEEATNNFDSDKELGDGGFGTVYYGKLRDGRAVAVKRLYENNWKRAEQFMNEVVILTRLHHQNLVSLYGCTSHRSRELVLVYEYIPNGTVADHLHGERAKPGALPWSTRMNIAIETASALVYLHASDIIHRDVKTNNILLDNNFCVKVADFGLSRLFPTHATHVSTAPQGTPGYVDPEYNECYRLTDKSDVFSFGVVLIELISSMPAVDITRHREEINLSNMAINKIQNHTLHEIVDPSLGFESDYSVRRMILAVAELAFQCLQHAKEMRPSMAKLLETLKEIQNKDCSKHDKVENQLDISADDEIVLLKRQHSLPVSPDSALNWISTSSGSTRST